jgi:hypothetical protein
MPAGGKSISAISDRWIGVPVAFELAVLVVALLALDAAVELELLELPHPAAISAAMANVSDKAFSLMSPLLVCIDLSSESSARKATTVSGSLTLSLDQESVDLRLPERADSVLSPMAAAPS